MSWARVTVAPLARSSASSRRNSVLDSRTRFDSFDTVERDQSTNTRSRMCSSAAVVVLTASRRRSINDPSGALNRKLVSPRAITPSSRWLAASDISKVAVKRRSLLPPTRRGENEDRGCTWLDRAEGSRFILIRLRRRGVSWESDGARVTPGARPHVRAGGHTTVLMKELTLGAPFTRQSRD